MRLVFDTNVLVSVLLTPGGTSDRALRAAVAIGATFLVQKSLNLATEWPRTPQIPPLTPRKKKKMVRAAL